MSTHHAQAGRDDSQPVLVEVGGPAGVAIGKRLWLVDGDGQRAVFLGATAIHVYDAADRDAQRVCIASLSKAGLAFDVEIAEAFGAHRNTVGRLARQLERQGIAVMVAAKRGPKGPHKVTGEVEAVIDQARSARYGYARDGHPAQRHPGCAAVWPSSPGRRLVGGYRSRARTRNEAIWSRRTGSAGQNTPGPQPSVIWAAASA